MKLPDGPKAGSTMQVDQEEFAGLLAGVVQRAEGKAAQSRTSTTGRTGLTAGTPDETGPD